MVAALAAASGVLRVLTRVAPLVLGHPSYFCGSAGGVEIAHSDREESLILPLPRGRNSLTMDVIALPDLPSNFRRRSRGML